MENKEIPYWRMDTRVRYIVVRPSKDSTFRRGDHVIQEANGDIICIEATGWISSADVPEAAEGMTVIPDIEYGKNRIKMILSEVQDIKELYGIYGDNYEN